MHRYLILSTLLFWGAISVAAPGDLWECQLCGKWQPLDRSFDGLPGKGETFELSETSVAIPGCSHVPYEILHFAKYAGPNYSDLAPERKPYELLIGTLATSNCAAPLGNIPTGSVLDVRRGYLNVTKELQLFVFSSAARERLLSLYAAGDDSANRPQPQLESQLGIPKPIGSWWVSHYDFNVCDQGMPFPGFRCAQIAKYVAAGELNAGLTELLSTADQSDRYTILKQHDTWMQSLSKKCASNKTGLNMHWILAFEEMCVAKQYSQRAESYLWKAQCLSRGRTKCLSMSPPPNPSINADAAR